MSVALSCALLIPTWKLGAAKDLGGELARLSAPPFMSLKNHTHRQNVCRRFELFCEGKVELRDALSGLSLQPLMIMNFLLLSKSSIF